MNGFLRRPRRAALAAITILVTASSLVSFGESYRGLYLWAGHHGLSGVWVAIWPLMVDTFIAVGELSLFVALADHWPPRSRFAAWTVTLAGLAVSVAGNVGHVAGHSLADRATAAVPPLAAAAALAVGLGVLKRVVGARLAGVPAATTKAIPAAGARASTRATRKASSHGAGKATETTRQAIREGQPVPSARALARDHQISRQTASRILASVLAEGNGHASQHPGQLTPT